MIVERDVFQAKYGRGDELVEVIKDGQEMAAKWGVSSQRILTDLTGPFFTVVWEVEYESLADFERTSEAFGDPEFEQWFARMPELIESGSRELFTIVK